MSSKQKVYIVCTGLGRVSRGFESFTNECFDALQSNEIYDIILLKGAGTEIHGKEKVIWSLNRNSTLAKLFKKPYLVEQLTFFLGMIPLLFVRQPFLIFYSDLALGAFLWHFRKVFNLRYKLLLSNGGPNFPPFSRTDYVQQLLPLQKRLALEAGEAAERHLVVPYGFNISEEQFSISKNQLRSKLNLPIDKTIIISVGVINKAHKRMHYLISEVEKLQDQSFFLLILGAEDAETIEIRTQAKEQLGASNYLISTVPANELTEYYQASDIFVLASTFEGFGRVLIEALANNLPVIAHNGQVFREVLGDMGTLVDMEQDGALTAQIKTFTFEKKTGNSSVSFREKAFNVYSWQRLKADYLAMFGKAMK